MTRPGPRTTLLLALALLVGAGFVVLRERLGDHVPEGPVDMAEVGPSGGPGTEPFRDPAGAPELQVRPEGARDGGERRPGSGASDDGGPAACELSLRVLGAAGRPLESREVWVLVEFRGESDGLPEVLRTDASGLLVLPLSAERVEARPKRLTVRPFLRVQGPIGDLSMSDSRSSRRERGSLALPDPLPPGRTHLGDLRLVAREGGAVVPLTELIHGTVLDPGGDPVPSASVSLEWFSDGGDRWRRLGSPSVTRDDGRFVVRDELDPRVSRFRLFVRATGYLDEVVPVVLDSDVEVRLRRASAVAGRVLVLDDQVRWLVDARRLRFEVRPTEEAVPDERIAEGVRPRRELARVERDGTFRVEGVAPGPSTLEVTLPGVPGLVHAVEGLMVPEAAELADPRLDPLDLRPHLRVWTVTLVEPGGRGVVPGTYRCVEGEPPEDWRAHPLAGGSLPLIAGRARVPAGDGPRTLLIWPDGHFPQRVDDVFGDRRFELPRRSRLVVRVRVPGLAPEDPVTGFFETAPLRLRSSSLGMSARSDTWDPGTGTRTLVFAGTPPGDYELVCEGQSVPVQVPVGVDEPTLDVVLDAGPLRTLLEVLDQVDF